ncbi:MAG: mannitol-1-phosphate 5-dehydrogenase [Phycisphaerae bacterium]|nr:mannitol-1-phosphate 5-dehydrogenase [Phycisphaerae bacterium]
MKRIVQFGAGNIGRSLVGQLFSRAGYEVTFVDAVEAIVRALNQRGRYEVIVKDALPPGQPDQLTVTNVRGLHASQAAEVAQAVARADVLATAVGPAALPKIAPTLAAGLAKRTAPVSIILCENLRAAAGHMRGWLGGHLPGGFDLPARVGLVETSIGKMVPIMPAEVVRQDPLVVWAEAYNQIIADRAGFLGPPPEVPGLVLKDNFAAYVDRKLFIHNLGHAAAAYFGYLRGRQSIWQCVEDEEIHARARAAMWASAEALIAKYPGEFDPANQADHVDDLLRRFANKALNDSVYRVGRDLYRKLGPEDRCIGSLRLARACGVDAEPILRTIAAALHFRACDEHGEMFPADAEFHEALRRQGPRGMLETHCGLNQPEDAADVERILAEYERIQPE